MSTIAKLVTTQTTKHHTVNQECVTLTPERLELFPVNTSGKRYYAQSERLVMEVEQGDVLTTSGVLIDSQNAVIKTISFEQAELPALSL